MRSFTLVEVLISMGVLAIVTLRSEKVVGYAPGADGSLVPDWSTMITWTLNPRTGDLLRNQVGEPSRLMGRGIVRFDVAVTAGSPGTVDLESRAGSANRGTEGCHTQTVRFTPRNRLR